MLFVFDKNIIMATGETGYGSCSCNYCKEETKGAMSCSSDSLTITEVASGDGNEDPNEPDNDAVC